VKWHERERDRVVKIYPPISRCFNLRLLLVLAICPAHFGVAQILMSGGTNYSQSFDTLAGANSGNSWKDNVTLPGWYAATNLTSTKSGSVTVYDAGTGSSGTGALYSFGGTGSAERALGSLASGGPGNFAFGVRFKNDTTQTVTNITISYVGEQWRCGGNTNVQSLAFAFLVGSALTDADAAGQRNWTAFPALDFNSPVTSSTAGALDGNAPGNQQAFPPMTLAGVAVPPGEEIFLRWYDVNDAGNDHGLAIDDLSVRYETKTFVSSVVTNDSVTLMTYNVKGNGVADWSTNTAQAQAIGREILHLHPDIITFNEIPHTNVWQMANWVAAFMPGFYLATNSGTDGFINSVIASRFPIARSDRWLTHASLDAFGYTNANFTRDLFEAEINVPHWTQPLHVFTTHLKSSSGDYADAVARRAAEAAAITNFFATNFFALHPWSPFTLSGDMNESDTNAAAIQELVSAPTSLRLTQPQNPFTGSINTYSIQGSLNERIDYIFPCALLFSNVIGSQVFRTDRLPAPLPPNLNPDDDQVASDHLPVLITFANPFAQPFRVTAFRRAGQTVNLQWESVPGGSYRVEASTNLVNWTSVATNRLTTNYLGAFSTNAVEPVKFFRVRTE
jgi:endonuclease/exonuclease/phosphatase family metal-dependent hydrolase